LSSLRRRSYPGNSSQGEQTLMKTAPAADKQLRT
jgi:hypothetical protein